MPPVRKPPLYGQVALIGNPNVGKSTVFNHLTGLKQHTGNWAGKTVSSAKGLYCGRGGKTYNIIDLPGTYSLFSDTGEERAVRDFICGGEYEVLIVIADAACLERGLSLVLQVLELTSKVVVCVNLIDEAKRKGIAVDYAALEKLLGVPVVACCAHNKKDAVSLMLRAEKLIEELEEESREELKISALAVPHKLFYGEPAEAAIAAVLPFYYNRFAAIDALGGHEYPEDTPDCSHALSSARELLRERGLSGGDWHRHIMSAIFTFVDNLAKKTVTAADLSSADRDRRADKFLTSKSTGIPMMLLFLGLIFWLTISGANYPSQWLSAAFNAFGVKLMAWVIAAGIEAAVYLPLLDGVYTTLTWVIAVMLPPMAIFFPLFTFLEELGYLPRVAFNLDNFFKRASTNGKQALTMCMGFGCNAAGVCGCRIIDSPRERLIAILTNSFVPCNGRFPLLITVSAMFLVGGSSLLSAVTVLTVVLIGIFFTFLVSRLLSLTVLKGVPSGFILELPSYRRPQLGRVIINSLLDRTVFVLGRAAAVAAPAGLLIWFLANFTHNGVTLLQICGDFFDPFGKMLGLDGFIIMAFILGIPANEIVLPIVVMCYLSLGTLTDMGSLESMRGLFLDNGWTMLTAVNMMLFCLLHYPCATTLWTIRKESGRVYWAVLAFIIPTVIGIVVCLLTAALYRLLI